MTEKDLYDIFYQEVNNPARRDRPEPIGVCARVAARLLAEREVSEGWPEGYLQDEDGLRGNGPVGDDDEIGHSLYHSSEGQWHSTITGRYRATRAEALEDARRGIWTAHGYSATKQDPSLAAAITRAETAEATLAKATTEIRKDFTAVCLDCGVVAGCDDDRCCESCGDDLILCADGASADLLIEYLKDAKKNHDQAEELAAARSEIDRLRVSLRAAIRGARQLAIAADFLNGGDDA